MTDENREQTQPGMQPPSPLPDVNSHIDLDGKGTPADPENPDPHIPRNGEQPHTVPEYEMPAESVLLLELREMQAMVRKQQMVTIYLGAVAVCLVAFYVFKRLPVAEVTESVSEANGG